MKTSDISPVANRVFTRLSPSEPPGRVSCVILMLGLAAWNASITAFAPATSVSVFPLRNVIVVAPALPSPPLLPRLPALQPAAIRVLAVARATSAALRRPDLWNFMEPPNSGWSANSALDGLITSFESFQNSTVALVAPARQVGVRTLDPIVIWMPETHPRSNAMRWVEQHALHLGCDDPRQRRPAHQRCPPR